ncbi:hypothetical protein ACFSKW_15715 [Nonomuraea mangrovi]|uniref:Transcription regulator PadR C-terminal domain-containing protein n=1 Tax=Nonomuraea mangrovi TaxID=2316207 RepID=A0ABW4SUV0_9ACTN
MRRRVARAADHLPRPVEEVARGLRDQATVAASRHEALEGIRAAVEEGDDNLSVYGRIVLEWGLRFTTAQREWAEWAEEQIR